VLIDYEVALEYINTYLDEIDRLIRLNYNVGRDAEDELMRRIRGFITSGFEDSEKKLKQISNPYSRTLKTEAQKQNSYINDLNFMKNNLIGIREEIMLKKSIPQNPKIEKILSQTEIKKAEAERRGAVADTKFYGAYIELITELRNQLKEKDIITNELRQIKQDIKDIKNMVKELKTE
jgi:Leucine-rich repeat (LRR) protein